MQGEEFIETELLKKEFGQMLRTLRRQYNLTQERLSELSGISDIYLRKIECGECTASWVIWLTLCTVLNVDVKNIQKNYFVPIVKRQAKKLGKVYVFTANN